MGRERQITVRMTLTPVPEFVRVVQGFLNRLAEQWGYSEGQRLNLREGLRQALGRREPSKPGRAGREWNLEFLGFPDRLEIVLETENESAGTNEAELYLLNQLLDRVVFEEAGPGRRRLTLVKYRAEGERTS